MQPVSTHLSSPLARPPSSPNANNDALPLSSEEPSTPEHQQPSLPLPTHDPVQQSHTKQSSSHINIPIIPFSSPQEQVTTHTALYHSQYTPENLFPRLPPSFRLQEADLWIAEAVKADANQFPLAENQVANLPPTSQHLSQEPNFNSFLPSLENYIQSSATELPNLLTQSQTHPKPHTIQPLAPSAVDFNPEQIENINFQGVDLLEAPWPNAPKASNKWSCPSCSFQFAYKDHLARHRAFVHEGKSESKCSHCNKIYVEFKSLRRHINQNHNNVSRNGVEFYCYWCHFTCNQLTVWRNHILSVHYGESYAHRINWENWNLWVEEETAKLRKSVFQT